MGETSPRIFLSAGTKRSDEQKQFIEALTGLLSSAGFETRQAQWSAISPLAKIKEELNGCDGAVMIAFERIYAKEGQERSTSEAFIQLIDLRFTTVWNHVEAAMAYCLDLPLFIVCEPNLREEGLLEKCDWYIYRTPLSAETTRKPEFLGIFQDWSERVRKHYNSRGNQSSLSGPGKRIQPETVTVGEILRNLTIVQTVALITAASGILAAAVVAGSKWPELAKLFQ